MAMPGSETISGGNGAQTLWLAHLRGQLTPGFPTLSEEEWSWLADEASRHQLRGLTYRLLADGPFAGQMPALVRDRLRTAYVDIAARNAWFFRQTSLIVRELERHGIPVMLLKGVHLARFVYAEPALRSMADVDIMVSRDQLPEAERVLLDQGFGPRPRPDLVERCTWSNHLDKLEKEGAPVVELHWHIERPRSAFSIDLAGLWQRSQPATLDGAPVRLLSPEDLVLHLVLHASYHHRFDRSALKAIVDVNAVLVRQGEAFHWQRLVDRAIEWKASGFVYTTLRLAVDILDSPIPEAVLHALPYERADGEMVDVARRYIMMPRAEVPRVFVKLAQSQTLLERTRLIFRGVFLTRRQMELSYRLRPGSPRVYWYYLARPATLLLKRSTLLLRALFHSRALRPHLDLDEDRLRLERWAKDPPGRPKDPIAS
jgi:hypothetical protein